MKIVDGLLVASESEVLRIVVSRLENGESLLNSELNVQNDGTVFVNTNYSSYYMECFNIHEVDDTITINGNEKERVSLYGKTLLTRIEDGNVTVAHLEVDDKLADILVNLSSNGFNLISVSNDDDEFVFYKGGSYLEVNRISSTSIYYYLSTDKEFNYENYYCEIDGVGLNDLPVIEEVIENAEFYKDDAFLNLYIMDDAVKIQAINDNSEYLDIDDENSTKMLGDNEKIIDFVKKYT